VLAARTLDIPVMLFSNGFTVPPRLRPLPNMRPWQNFPEVQLLALEDHALGSINRVLQGFGKPPLSALHQLFDVAEEALITYPELDHYENRGVARYWGSLPNAAIGIAPPWPNAAGKRLFAYLRADTPHVEAVLDLLQRLAQPTVIYFPGMPEALRAKHQANTMVFVADPVDIERAAREADVAVTYSSLATTTAFLIAGKPLLLLPTHLEQFLLARRVVGMGAGRAVSAEQSPAELQPFMTDLLNNPAYADNARAFSAKYAGFGQATVMENLVRRVEALCNTGKQ
jgi:UDP:flavonoid glycosyltransferase YjiC (YdhE family)